MVDSKYMFRGQMNIRGFFPVQQWYESSITLQGMGEKVGRCLLSHFCEPTLPSLLIAVLYFSSFHFAAITQKFNANRYVAFDFLKLVFQRKSALCWKALYQWGKYFSSSLTCTSWLIDVCVLQISQSKRCRNSYDWSGDRFYVPIVHGVEILPWASGNPCLLFTP